MIIATSGHVDHGKTSLVRRLTGIDTDRLVEEKKRGLTIDLGYAYCSRGSNQLGFIDVPGHTKFINNMVAGVGEIDFGLLVIAADDGPMPQTQEHLAILNLIGVTKGAIALTKTDRVDARRVAEVTEQIKSLAMDTFLSQDNCEIFKISNETGDGIEALADYLYDTSSRLESKSATGFFRLSIDRCFSVKGSGLVVTGSVLAGQASVGDQVLINPGQHIARIRGIHRQNKPSDMGRAGDRCAINISAQGLEKTDIHRGSHLSTKLDKRETERCDIALHILPDEARSLKHWTSVHVHFAASHTRGRVATLDSTAIAPGTTGLAQLVLTEPLNLCVGDSIIIRDQAAERTLGGGFVLDPVSVVRGRAKPDRVALLNKIKTAWDSRQVDITLTSSIDANPLGVPISTIENAFNFTKSEIEEHLGLIHQTGKPIATLEKASSDQIYLSEDDQLISDQNLKNLTSSMSEKLQSLLNNDKQKNGATLSQISSMISNKLSAGVATLAANSLVAKEKWSFANGLYGLSGHRAEMSSAAAKLWEKVEPILQSDPIRPPVVHDLAKTLNLPPRALEKLLSELTKLGYLIKPVSNRYFLPEGISQLELHVHETSRLNADGKFSVKEYRDVTQIGRNLCIEILEYFDIKRITQRIGDQRITIAKQS